MSDSGEEVNTLNAQTFTTPDINTVTEESRLCHNDHQNVMTITCPACPVFQGSLVAAEK